MLYEIIIGDSWFDELNVTRQADSMTTLRGRLIDQAALQGVLRRISDLGMELISVNSIPETDEPRGDET
jgi:hypothetical protein